MPKSYPSPESLRDVAQFHRTFHLPVVAQPSIPSADRCRLRINLLREELDELEAAIADNDLTEVADALADLQYVLSGAVLEFGMGDRFKAVFEEVHRSNMSKTCASEEEAQATVDHYTALDQPGRVVPSQGVYLVHRLEDGKVLKNVNYSPADIAASLHG